MASGRSLRRLARDAEFRGVYQRGVRRVTSLVIAHMLPNDSDTVRLGIAVSRRLGGAVVRNRLRRRLREAVRAHQRCLKTGVDLVVVPREPALRATYAELLAGVGAVLAAGGLLRNGAEDGENE